MFNKNIKFWGTSSLGERGQIVIPLGARKELKLKKGEKLVIFSKGNKFLCIVKADEISKRLRDWLSKIEK